MPDIPPGSAATTAQPEQPYGPGAICDDCGHLAERHNPEGCHFPRPADNPCRCVGMLWLDVRWPRPWLPAPEGLTGMTEPTTAAATPTRVTARCPVCHRRQPLVCTRTGHVYAAHRSGSRECSGSGRAQ